MKKVFLLLTVCVLALAGTQTVFAQSEVNTYYVYITAWGNGSTPYLEQENGSKGVVYVTNVFTVRSSFSLSTAAIKKQFSEEILNRYGKERAYIYNTNGVVSIKSENSYDKAGAARRKDISKFVTQGAKVRYMNHFEFYED